MIKRKEESKTYNRIIKIMGVPKFARIMKTSEDSAIFALGMFYGGLILVIVGIIIGR